MHASGLLLVTVGKHASYNLDHNLASFESSFVTKYKGENITVSNLIYTSLCGKKPLNTIYNYIYNIIYIYYVIYNIIIYTPL